jgi:hypothetical protein
MSIINQTKCYFDGYLKSPPGVSEDRLRAYQLPSMVNGKRQKPTNSKYTVLGNTKQQAGDNNQHIK